MVAGLSRWRWISPRSASLGTELVRAVAAAEQVATELDDQLPTQLPRSEIVRMQRAYWRRALTLAMELRQHEPAPHPTVIEEALARIEAAALRLGLEPGADTL